MLCNGGGCLEIGGFELETTSHAGSHGRGGGGLLRLKTGQCREIVGDEGA